LQHKKYFNTFSANHLNLNFWKINVGYYVIGKKLAVEFSMSHIIVYSTYWLIFTLQHPEQRFLTYFSKLDHWHVPNFGLWHKGTEKQNRTQKTPCT